MKIFSYKTIFLFLICISQAYAIQTITLNNATSCMVIYQEDGSKKYQKVTAVDVYSFYSNNDVRTYFSTIRAGSMGTAAISLSSGMNIPGIDMGYAPSAGYMTGSLGFYSQDWSEFNNAYIMQMEDLREKGRQCGVIPCMSIEKVNLCQ